MMNEKNREKPPDVSSASAGIDGIIKKYTRSSKSLIKAKKCSPKMEIISNALISLLEHSNTSLYDSQEKINK